MKTVWQTKPKAHSYVNKNCNHSALSTALNECHCVTFCSIIMQFITAITKWRNGRTCELGTTSTSNVCDDSSCWMRISSNNNSKLVWGIWKCRRLILVCIHICRKYCKKNLFQREHWNKFTSCPYCNTHTSRDFVLNRLE